MNSKHKMMNLVGIILCGSLLAACGFDRRVLLVEQLMDAREIDSAIEVMREMKEPVHQLSDRDYALYVLLMSEAIHRKQQINAATDTLLLPAIKSFSQSGILCMPSVPSTIRSI